MPQKLEPALFVPDCHVPYHNPQAWSLMLRAATDLRPKHLITLGDFADFYTVSTHSKDPRRALNLKAEVETVNEKLDELDDLGAEDKRFLGGNHCLSTEHRILTTEGWKGYQDVGVGTLAATRNAEGLLEWQPVERVVLRQVEPGEKVYDYTSRLLSIRVTDQHNVWGWTGAKGVAVHKAKDWIGTFDALTAIHSGDTDYPLSDEELRLAAWASTDVHYDRRGATVTFYQSEGKHHHVRKVLTDAGIAFSERRRIRDIKQICGKILKKPPKPCYEFDVKGDDARRIRRLTGLSAKGRLPQWTMQLSDRQWDLFVRELIFADGSTHIAGHNAHMFYGKLPICEDVQCAAVTHGWQATISEYRPTHFRVNLTPSWKSRIEQWHDFVVTPDPSEQVWCVTVPNHTLIVERHHKVHVTGNCDRLRRYLQDKAPELFHTVSIPKLFRLPERGWAYIPYKSDTKLGKVRCCHDVDTSGRHSVYRALDVYQHSVISAHAHRFAQVVEGNPDGEFKLSAQFGWLGDADAVDYRHRALVKKEWSLGFGIGWLDPASGIVYTTGVPIIPGKRGELTCCVNGKLYRG